MQPREYDAVLGHGIPFPVGAAVLGGLEGVRQRLASSTVADRIAALHQSTQYGSPGLVLIIQALQDPNIQVQKAAYLLLQHHPATDAQQALAAYSTFPLFEPLATLKGHQGGITAVAISPDHRTLVSASRDGLLKVWDWRAEEAVFTIPAAKYVYTITVSHDGQSFTVRQPNQTLSAWSLKNGQAIAPEAQPTRGISSVTANKDRYLVSGSQTLIKIWDLQRGRELCTLKGHTSLVTSVALSRDRQLLISGSEDRTVRVWGVA